MSRARNTVLEWADEGHIAAADLPRAFAIAGALPARADWRRFLDHLLLWLGTALIAFGLVFFLAYNWQDLGRFAKFALAEALVLVALGAIAHFGPERPAGRAALFAASVFTGALLALIGQTYQTGADTFELFVAWAALILPWVAVGRFAPLWMFWLALTNLAVVLYFEAVLRPLSVAWRGDEVAWALFALDTTALVIWEFARTRGVAWLRERWSPRVLAFVSGGIATAHALEHIGLRAADDAVPIIVWAVWLAAAFWFYRLRDKDLFVLAGGVLSVTLVVATFLARQIRWSDAGSFLLIGLTVIALSAAGGWWLKRIAAEDGLR